MGQNAVLYLRSSKDRSDVSIDAQRRELTQLAAARGCTVVGEFSDVVLSAKTDDRPAFQRLLAQLKQRDRGWDTIMVMDTSRLARGVYFAQVFNRECDKYGVRVIYSKIPELDPMVKIMLLPILQANDELHSYMSRVKGLAGMRENVHRGYRAGGRAPWGYKLRVIETGAMREGRPVTKSTLELVPGVCEIAQRYLRLRAAGVARSAAAKQAGLKKALTSLVGTDWQALTYAGHTVWGVHQPRVHGRGNIQTKRRPRSEWVIQRNTHPALISEQQAEKILDQITNSKMSQAISAAKRQVSKYLLSGLLQTPDGKAWHGSLQRYKDGLPVPFYRVGTRIVLASSIEQAVVRQVLGDLRSDAFVAALVVEASRAAKKPADDPIKPLKLEQQRLAREVDKMMQLAGQMANPAPALRRAEAIEAERHALTDRIREAESRTTEQKAIAAITPSGIKKMLSDLSESAETLQGQELKVLLQTLVEKILLDPCSDEASIHYSIASAPETTCELVAFPRGHVRFAGLCVVRRVRIRRRLLRAWQYRPSPPVGPAEGLF